MFRFSSWDDVKKIDPVMEIFWGSVAQIAQWLNYKTDLLKAFHQKKN
jgi:hypothetical protein